MKGCWDQRRVRKKLFHTQWDAPLSLFLFCKPLWCLSTPSRVLQKPSFCPFTPFSSQGKKTMTENSTNISIQPSSRFMKDYIPINAEENEPGMWLMLGSRHWLSKSEITETLCWGLEKDPLSVHILQSSLNSTDLGKIWAHSPQTWCHPLLGNHSDTNSVAVWSLDQSFFSKKIRSITLTCFYIKSRNTP